MTIDFTICTVKFSLVNDSHPKLNVSVNYFCEGAEQLIITHTCCFSHMNYIHSKEFDLLILKQANDIPGWYSLITNPYKLHVQSSFSEQDNTLQILR